MKPLHLTHGLLIAFEGIDGAGKTTQMARLADALRSIGLTVLCTKEPTNGQWGAELRASAKAGRLSLERELDLFMRDRREHLTTLVEPALAAGHVVLVDRYYLSTVAYQGARGADPEWVLDANEQFAKVPDAVFLLQLDVEEGLRRIRTRGDIPNEFERAEDLERVAAVFESISRFYVQRIDASRDFETVARVILEHTVEGLLFERLCAFRTGKRSCNAFECAKGCPFHAASALLAEPSETAGAVVAALNAGVTDPDELRRLMLRTKRRAEAQG